MDRCLLDTSALSDVIQSAAKRPAAVARNLAEYLRLHGRLTFSEISCYEILRGLRKKQTAVQEQQFNLFCAHCELLHVTYHVLDHAALLWAQGQSQCITVDDADLIIASTAILQSVPVVTANTRHFTWINGLTLLNWRI